MKSLVQLEHSEKYQMLLEINQTHVFYEVVFYISVTNDNRKRAFLNRFCP